MAERILTLRDLNRATLARQMLLERATVPVTAAVERLVGLQAQMPRPPFVGLWTRLEGFTRDDLIREIEGRRVVKATFMRATLHLLTADDYLRFRSTLAPVLTGASATIAKQRGADFDVEVVLDAARRFIGEQPRTFAEISDMLAQVMPDQEVAAMRYTVRTHLPLVQVPSDAEWRYPAQPAFDLAETWLGRPPAPEEDFRALVFRYLAAFGPAGVTDLQTWSGLPKLKEAMEVLKPELCVYRDENRRELFDLPDIPLPDADIPAPVRFLPEFDNLLLSHSNRRRVVADAHRAKVYLPGLRVAATFLVDGFVRGVWRIEKTKGEATLVIEPFEAGGGGKGAGDGAALGGSEGGGLTPQVRGALEEEAERLVRFAEPSAKGFAVRVGEAG